MTISTDWVGPSHLFERPWIPPEFLTNVEALTARLDQRADTLARLASKRRDFRSYGLLPDQDEAFDQLWRLRSELVVADKLLDVDVEVTIGRDSPDLECRLGDRRFGVEITTRYPVTIEHALRTRLAAICSSGQGCVVFLRRQQPLVFTIHDNARRAAVEQVVAAVVDSTAPVVSLNLAETGFTAEIVRGAAITSEHHVVVENDMPLHDADYWPTLAHEIITSVRDKAAKTYSMDSVLALDITRLGWTGQWPITVEATSAFDTVLDNYQAEWGPLKGVVLFRSWMWDQTDPAANTVQLFTFRGGDMARMVAALLCVTVSAA